MSNKTSKIHDKYDVALNFRIPKSHYFIILKYCSQNDLSLSSFLRKLIENFVINIE